MKLINVVNSIMVVALASVMSVKGSEVGAWYYPAGESASQVATAASNLGGLNYIIIPSGATNLGDSTYFNNQKTLFNQIAASTGARIILMTLQDPAFINPTKLSNAQTLVTRTVQLCLAMNQAAGHTVCSEVHFDVEPWTTTAWTSGTTTDQQNILNQMTTLFTNMRSTINSAISTYGPGSTVNMSAAITWWLFSKAPLQSNTASMVATLDKIYIMSYGSGSSTASSIETNLAPKSGNSNSVIRSKSYYGGVHVGEFSSVANAVSASNSVRSYMSSDSAYLGNCFFKLNLAF